MANLTAVNSLKSGLLRSVTYCPTAPGAQLEGLLGTVRITKSHCTYPLR
jgi:hypothetical protein